MTSTRPVIPPTNLKERIAALEQRTTGNGGTRATSPTPSAASSGAGSLQAPPGGLRDKIARFEKKGGVPVPRGSFGLGAPPVAEGPRVRGELYGNRIPQARALSAQYTGGGLVPQYTGGPLVPQYTGGSGLTPQFTGSGGLTPQFTGGSFRAPSPVGDSRRSVSASSVFSDFDPQAEYTPVTSPTFAFPLDSPESTSYSPEGSPTLPPNDEPPSARRTIIRGTSFHEALELARKTEMAKQDFKGPGMKLDTFRPMDSTEEMVESPTTPTQRLKTLEEEVSVDHTEQDPDIAPSSPVSAPQSAHESITEEEDKPLSPAATLSQPTFIESSLASPEPESADAGVEDPVVDESKPEVAPSVFKVSPLMVRKRTATDPALTAAESSPPALGEGTTSQEPVLDGTATLSHPNGEVVIPSSEPPEEPRSPMIDEAQSNSSNFNEMSSIINPPEIVVNGDGAITSESGSEKPSGEIDKHAEIAARKAALTLDPDRLVQDALASPPAGTNMSAMSITDVISNYFTGGNPAGTFRTTTPPPVPAPPTELSPLATLPYDDETTPPRAKPTVNPPDPTSFLSPPPTGFRSAILSSGGSSLRTMSSAGSSRPMSMIETSPGHVSRALRMTPATSRGVPMFLPPNSSRARKSDFVYFPASPEGVPNTAAIQEEDGFDEFGGEHRRRGSEPDLSKPALPRPATTFKAVVHGKVREKPASATMPAKKAVRTLPETPQMKRIKRATILQTPLSPGHGELAALLQEAMLLEDSLNKGELPSEVEVDHAEIMAREEAEKAEARAREEDSRRKEEERQRLAYATAQLQAKRDMPTSGKLKHTFLVPLSKAKSTHRKEISNGAAALSVPRGSIDEALRPKSAGENHSGARNGRQELSEAQRSQTPDGLGPQMQPSKSPKGSRFATFKRMGSISRQGSSYDPATRHSNSTSSEISSEDSNFVVTPPDNALEFGMRTPSTNEFGHQRSHTQNNSMSFPALSPKKSSSSLGRATSFAEKMWSRARTKSNGSVLSSTSELTDRTEEYQPKRSGEGFNRPPLPPIPSAGTPLYENNVLNPTPSRSTSLNRGVLPSTPLTGVPPVPTITASVYHSQAPSRAPTQHSEDESLLFPGSNTSTRPSSMASISSAGSLPSPLFDKEIFDAFPSVPSNTAAPATTIAHSFPHRRDESLTTGATADFDTAFLSSAIHLASRKASGPPASAAPSTASYSRRAKTPTQGRRSGESAR